jgi:hypothetical protein
LDFSILDNIKSDSTLEILPFPSSRGWIIKNHRYTIELLTTVSGVLLNQEKKFSISSSKIALSGAS